VSVVNPFEPANFNRALWCVHGRDGSPQIQAFMVNDAGVNGTATIWGYSIYRKSPGFRTLGLRLDTWLSDKHDPVFYDDRNDAMNALGARMPSNRTLDAMRKRGSLRD
jgi:hypothetical protein